MSHAKHPDLDPGLMTYDEYVEFGESEAAVYSEVTAQLGIKNATDVHAPLIEAGYRLTTERWSASLPGNASPDPMNVLRDVAISYGDRLSRVDRERGKWQRKTQQGIDANLRRGMETRDRVTSEATKVAESHRLGWKPCAGRAPAIVVAVVARRVGKSKSTVRRILNGEV